MLVPFVANALTTQESYKVIHTPGTVLEAKGGIVLEKPDTSVSRSQSPDTSGFSALILETFPDAPYMLDVARCESSVRQYLPSGEVLMGGGGNNYIGIFQVNRAYEKDALSMGYDIYTADGNIGYSKYLFDRYGPSQWECAFKLGYVQ